MERPLRVLHVVSSLGRRGGRMAVVMNYYRALNRERVQFDFLYFEPMAFSYEAEIRALGGQLHYLPRVAGQSRLAFERGPLKDFFARQGAAYRAVHYHVLSPGLTALKWARWAGCPLRVAHGHSTRFGTGFIRQVRNGLACRYLRHFANSGLACCTAAARLLFGRQWQKQAKLLHNAIPVERYAFDAAKRDALRRAEGLEGRLVLGTVGRLSPEKNQSFLLDVLAALKQRRADSCLVIVGDNGGLLGQLRQRARQMGLEADVRFYLDRDDVGELLNLMDVFMLPSLYEGVPLVLVEAQANGLPCVAAEGVPEEAALTPLVRRLPAHAERWAETALAWNREALAGEWAATLPDDYDVAKAAPELERFYLDGAEK